MRHPAALLIALALFAVPAVALSQDPKSADPAKGKQVYEIYCMTCHGPLGDGKGPVGVTLQPPPRDFTKAEFKYGGTDQDLFAVITNGAASRGGSPLMAPWGSVIPEADRWAVIAYIHSLKK